MVCDLRFSPSQHALQYIDLAIDETLMRKVNRTTVASLAILQKKKKFSYF
jgi:hypothetical protein